MGVVYPSMVDRVPVGGFFCDGLWLDKDLGSC